MNATVIWSLFASSSLAARLVQVVVVALLYCHRLPISFSGTQLWMHGQHFFLYLQHLVGPNQFGSPPPTYPMPVSFFLALLIDLKLRVGDLSKNNLVANQSQDGGAENGIQFLSKWFDVLNTIQLHS